MKKKLYSSFIKKILYFELLVFSSISPSKEFPLTLDGLTFEIYQGRTDDDHIP
jgi:hypothetical protein